MPARYLSRIPNPESRIPSHVPDHLRLLQPADYEPVVWERVVVPRTNRNNFMEDVYYKPQATDPHLIALLALMGGRPSTTQLRSSREAERFTKMMRISKRPDAAALANADWKRRSRCKPGDRLRALTAQVHELRSTADSRLAECAANLQSAEAMISEISRLDSVVAELNTHKLRSAAASRSSSSESRGSGVPCGFGYPLSMVANPE